jgi:hypothetical protein
MGIVKDDKASGNSREMVDIGTLSIQHLRTNLMDQEVQLYI